MKPRMRRHESGPQYNQKPCERYRWNDYSIRIGKADRRMLRGDREERKYDPATSGIFRKGDGVSKAKVKRRWRDRKAHFSHFPDRTLCGIGAGSYSNYRAKVTCKRCLKLLKQGKRMSRKYHAIGSCD